MKCKSVTASAAILFKKTGTSIIHRLHRQHRQNTSSTGPCCLFCLCCLRIIEDPQEDSLTPTFASSSFLCFHRNEREASWTWARGSRRQRWQGSSGRRWQRHHLMVGRRRKTVISIIHEVAPCWNCWDGSGNEESGEDPLGCAKYVGEFGDSRY